MPIMLDRGRSSMGDFLSLKSLLLVSSIAISSITGAIGAWGWIEMKLDTKLEPIKLDLSMLRKDVHYLKCSGVRFIGADCADLRDLRKP